MGACCLFGIIAKANLKLTIANNVIIKAITKLRVKSLLIFICVHQFKVQTTQKKLEKQFYQITLI